MVKFHLIYNPYLVETKLDVCLENVWVPVSDESGLLHISRARMQRWLDPSSKLCNGKSYFDELLEASGERRLEIYFSGTLEDLSDITEAAGNYMNAHPQFEIKIIGDEQTTQNDSKKKFRELENILQEVRTSQFRSLLPKGFWDLINKKKFFRDADSVQVVELRNWKKNYMFETYDWQMLCVLFPFKNMHDERLRQKFRDFGECMLQVENRNFERERFLFLCRCEDDYLAGSETSFGTVKKLLMEYGLQDLNFLLLTAKELQTSQEMPLEKLNDRLKELKKIKSVFTRRYSEQYRLKKIHDVLKKILFDNGFVSERRRNIRRIEALFPNVSDKEKYEADKWISDLFERLKLLVEICVEEVSP